MGHSVDEKENEIRNKIPLAVVSRTIAASHSVVTDYVTVLIFDRSKMQSSENSGAPRRTAGVRESGQAITVILAADEPEPARSGA